MCRRQALLGHSFLQQYSRDGYNLSLYFTLTRGEGSTQCCVYIFYANHNINTHFCKYWKLYFIESWVNSMVFNKQKQSKLENRNQAVYLFNGYSDRDLLHGNKMARDISCVMMFAKAICSVDALTHTCPTMPYIFLICFPPPSES